MLDTVFDSHDEAAPLDRALREIDEIAGAMEEPLTATQVNFLRDVTKRNYCGRHPVLDGESLNWLIERFSDTPTIFRALALALLVDRRDLPNATGDLIEALLNDSLGDRFLSGF